MVHCCHSMAPSIQRGRNLIAMIEPVMGQGHHRYAQMGQCRQFEFSAAVSAMTAKSALTSDNASIETHSIYVTLYVRTTELPGCCRTLIKTKP